MLANVGALGSKLRIRALRLSSSYLLELGNRACVRRGSHEIGRNLLHAQVRWRSDRAVRAGSVEVAVTALLFPICFPKYVLIHLLDLLERLLVVTSGAGVSDLAL